MLVQQLVIIIVYSMSKLLKHLKIDLFYLNKKKNFSLYPP